MRSGAAVSVTDTATPAHRDAALARQIMSYTGFEAEQSRAYDAALEELAALARSRAEIHRRELTLIGALHDNAGFAMIEGAVPGKPRSHPSDGGATDTWLDLSEVVAADLATVLHLSEWSTRSLVAVALRVRRDYRSAAHDLGQGGLSEHKLAILLKETTNCPPDALDLVQRDVLPGAETLTPKQFGDTVRAAVITHAADSVQLLRRRGTADRRVSIRHEEDGMGTLYADLPNLTLRAMDTVLEALAGSAANTDQRTKAQRRADTLTALVLGPGHLLTGDVDPAQASLEFDPLAGTYTVTDHDAVEINETLDVVADLLAQIDWTLARPVPADIRLVLPATVLTGACPCGHQQNGGAGVATVDGLGPVDADLAARLAADGRWTRILTDPVTGTVTDVGTTTYRFPAPMRRRIGERDQTCRYPGCHRPFVKADIDHVVPFPLGPTADANGETLCRTHHRLKHQTHWHSRMAPDGTTTWTSPTGRIFITSPPDLTRGPVARD